MSILCGLLKNPGNRVESREMQRFAAPMARYATTSTAVCTRGRGGMALQPSPTHERSKLNQAPLFDLHGNLLAFDGRLDNYLELAELLDSNAAETSDAALVLKAFERWKDGCFARFTGDWALALWSPRSQQLFLARDHAGTRTLYFHKQPHQVAWATHLDAFGAEQNHFRLCKSYARSYLSCDPIRDSTPWEGIRAVLPGHHVVVTGDCIQQRAHWSPLVRTSIRYKRDAEYEEHFLHLFGQAVERRTGAGEPILAQLSGGMDSTAIVCMSDHLRRSADPAAEILDTVSFYDDSEVSLQERPYFTLTEQRRGKAGIHLNVAFSQRTLEPLPASEGRYLLPGADSFTLEQERMFEEQVWSRGYRVVLSGIGGDEVLGGVPNGTPELADYLVKGRFPTLLRRSLAWSLVSRTPLLFSLGNTIGHTYGTYLGPKRTSAPPPPWVLSNSSCGCAACAGATDVPQFSWRATPSQLDNATAWWWVLESLPHTFPHLLRRPEYRYPFLDKDLVGWLFSIPREQILRPGRRRSLMRRALVNIVPTEILERPRKAFQLRAPLKRICESHSTLEQLLREPRLGDLGFVEVDALRTCLKRITQGDATWWQAFLRAIALELWLRSQG